MKTGPFDMMNRRVSGSLLCCALMGGCASSPAPPEPSEPRAAANPASVVPSGDQGSADSDLETLESIVVAPLSPEQGVLERNVGERVRWSGGVQRIRVTDEGVCLTILHTWTGDVHEPRSNHASTSQRFEACGPGAYDPALVREFTSVTIIGRISGTTEVGMGGGRRTGARVQIEKLFRWSDCLQGAVSPQCRYGFLSPDYTGSNPAMR